MLSESKQVGLFPCRGPVVPCRTLFLVWATCRGTVKPRVSGRSVVSMKPGNAGGGKGP
jgi:hypothetical protein